MSEPVGIWIKMDVGIRSGILCQLRKYGGSVYAVWMCLGSHVGDKGHCWPSLRTIAKETGYSLGSVQKAIAALESEGLIYKWHRQPDGQGNYYSNIYHLKGWFSYGREV